MGSSPNKKSIASYQRADMNNFVKGISDMKVAYVPFFGHSTLQYEDYSHQKSAWKEICKNIINSGAPKHSAILEMVQNQYKKEELQQELQKRQKSKNAPYHKVSFNERDQSDKVSRQKSNTQLQRQNSRKKALTVKFDKERSSQYEIEKEILSRLKWWRLGSKDDDEHGFRARQSNFSIKILDLKEMQNESKQMLIEHEQQSKFFQSFIKNKEDKPINKVAIFSKQS
eukprot:403370951